MYNKFCGEKQCMHFPDQPKDWSSHLRTVPSYPFLILGTIFLTVSFYLTPISLLHSDSVMMKFHTEDDAVRDYEPGLIHEAL